MDACYRNGEMDRTISLGKKFISRFPNYGFAHKIIADAYSKKGNRDQYRAHLIRAMQLDQEFVSSMKEFEKYFLKDR